MIKRLKHKIKMIYQKLRYNFCDEDTYSLNAYEMKRVNKLYKRYLELSSEIIDLSYFKYNIKGKEMTQKEVIERIIELSQLYLDKYDNPFTNYDSDCESWEKELNELLDEYFECRRKVFLQMWW